jgi:predicted acylesterase/phospholipase RssA
MYFALTAGGGSARWQTSKGEPTAGTYGFARELLRIIEQEAPDYIAVAFDTGKTFRDKIFPAYKGTRAKMPDDLSPQIGRIRTMIDAFNIMEDRIARARLAGDPPDVMISPRIGQVGWFDFHRAHEAIVAGARAAERALDDIAEALAVLSPRPAPVTPAVK